MRKIAWMAVVAAVTAGLMITGRAQTDGADVRSDQHVGRGGGPGHDDDNDFEPNGKGGTDAPTKRAKPAPTGPSGNGINYHNGPVLLGTTNIYYIWYGNWGGNSAISILSDFAKNIGGSPYFNINTTYYNAAKQHVSNSVGFNSTAVPYFDSYSRGTSISDSDVKTIVSTAIGGGSLPKDTNGVYFVLTSADVKEKSGFCSQYCGWHTNGSISGSDIKYAFIGNPDQCPNACAAQTKGPNGNAGADAMASIIAHELEESVTDPDLNAWFDNKGEENADKCAWTFGKYYKAANGASANVKLGSRDYLIQQNWVNASGGKCALSY